MLSGCTRVGFCTRPDLNASPGYTILNESSLLAVSDEFAVTVACAAGYISATPEASVCAAAGEPYSLRGCFASAAEAERGATHAQGSKRLSAVSDLLNPADSESSEARPLTWVDPAPAEESTAQDPVFDKAVC